MAASRLHESFYAILEVDPSADGAEISASYRRLARLRHPDKNPNNPSATADFQKLQEAYSTLVDSHKRLQYDCRDQSVPYPAGRRKQGPYTVNTFHVNLHWTGPSGPQTERTNTETSRSSCSIPTRDGILDRQIQEVRQQIRQDQQVFVQLEQKQARVSQSIDAALAKIELMNCTLRRIRTTTRNTQNEQEAESLNGQSWVDSRYGQIPAAKTYPRADNKTNGPSEAETKLLMKITESQQDLESLVDQSRSAAVEMKHIEARTTRRKTALHNLCSEWREKTFNGGGKPGDNTGTGWDGWDGWCCWDAVTNPELDADQPESRCWRDEAVGWQGSEEKRAPSMYGPDFGLDDLESGDQPLEEDLSDGESIGAGGQGRSTTECETQSPASKTDPGLDRFDEDLIDLGLTTSPQVNPVEKAWLPTIEKDGEHFSEEWGQAEPAWDQPTWHEW